MGRRGNRIVTAAVVTSLVAVPGWSKTNYHSGIWNILRSANFCFAENGDSRAWPAGALDAGGKHYQIWGYAWEETPQTKAASMEHVAYRILVFEKTKTALSFLGNYKVDGVPFHIQDRTIKFDYGKSWPGEGPIIGNQITFTDEGIPRSEPRDFDPVPYPKIACQ